MTGEADRRRSKRFEPQRHVDVMLWPQGIPLVLLDVATGGCLVGSPRHLPTDEPLELLFRTPDHSWCAVLHGRFVHSRLHGWPGQESASWVTGIAFAPTDTTEVQIAIHDLLALVTADGQDEPAGERRSPWRWPDYGR